MIILVEIAFMILGVIYYIISWKYCYEIIDRPDYTDETIGNFFR